ALALSSSLSTTTMSHEISSLTCAPSAASVCRSPCGRRKVGLTMVARGSAIEDGPVDVDVLAHAAVPVERCCPLLGALGLLVPTGLALEQQNDGLHKGGHVAVGHEQATVAHDLRGRRVVEGDHGRPACHGLQRGEAETLVSTRHDR